MFKRLSAGPEESATPPTQSFGTGRLIEGFAWRAVLEEADGAGSSIVCPAAIADWGGTSRAFASDRMVGTIKPRHGP